MVDENTSPTPARPSGGGNFLFWVLAIAGVGLVLCCGGLGIVGWKAQSWMANMVTSDPAEIRQKTADMVDMAIPEAYKPMQGMNMVAFQLVMYQTGDAADGSTGMLMLMEMPKIGGNVNQQEQELRKSMRQQQANQNFKTTKTETREIEIRGEKIPFEFSEGTGGASGQEKTMHIVSGVFRGKRGPVMLQLMVPDEDYDEAAVLEMLQSIQ